MITTAGSTVIKRFFGSEIAQIAQTMAVGVSSVGESRESVIMGGEVLNVPIVSISSDITNSRLVFKGIIPPSSSYLVHEIGLYQGDNQRQNVSLGLVDPTFTWTNATIEGAGRVNQSMLRVAFTANTATTATRENVSEDFGDFQPSDYFSVNFVGHANLANLAIRIGTDSSNYYTFTASGPAPGYNIIRWNKSSGVTTGNPDWESIGYLSVRPTGSAAGAGFVNIDRIGFEQSPTNTNNILVARKVLVTPYQPDPLVPNEVEYALGISA